MVIDTLSQIQSYLIKKKIDREILSYYKLPKGLPNKTFANLVTKAIEYCNSQVMEHYSEDFRQKYKLCNITTL